MRSPPPLRMPPHGGTATTMAETMSAMMSDTMLQMRCEMAERGETSCAGGGVGGRGVKGKREFA